MFRKEDEFISFLFIKWTFSSYLTKPKWPQQEFSNSNIFPWTFKDFPSTSISHYHFMNKIYLFSSMWYGAWVIFRASIASLYTHLICQRPTSIWASRNTYTCTEENFPTKTFQSPNFLTEIRNLTIQSF